MCSGICCEHSSSNPQHTGNKIGMVVLLLNHFGYIVNNSYRNPKRSLNGCFDIEIPLLYKTSSVIKYCPLSGISHILPYKTVPKANCVGTSISDNIFIEVTFFSLPISSNRQTSLSRKNVNQR